MTYELAKQFKDAGFPQPDNIGEKILTGHIGRHEYIKGCYLPTLSELIEACMGKLWQLENDLFRVDKVDWEWRCITKKVNGDKCSFGNTPEEAVARLWLALNSEE